MASKYIWCDLFNLHIIQEKQDERFNSGEPRERKLSYQGFTMEEMTIDEAKQLVIATVKSIKKWQSKGEVVRKKVYELKLNNVAKTLEMKESTLFNKICKRSGMDRSSINNFKIAATVEIKLGLEQGELKIKPLLTLHQTVYDENDWLAVFKIVRDELCGGDTKLLTSPMISTAFDIFEDRNDDIERDVSTYLPNKKVSNSRNILKNGANKAESVVNHDANDNATANKTGTVKANRVAKVNNNAKETSKVEAEVNEARKVKLADTNVKAKEEKADAAQKQLSSFSETTLQKLHEKLKDKRSLTRNLVVFARHSNSKQFRSFLNNLP